LESFLLALATAFGVIFLAEFGDKSQILLVAQAARSGHVRVLIEAVLAFAVLTALAVTVGAIVARFVPEALLAIFSGLLFLLFAVHALREAREGEDEHEHEHDHDATKLRYGGTFALVFAAEMGDKTQLATAALAAWSGRAFATGLGSWLAESASAVLAVAAGRWLSGRVSSKATEYGSALLFLVVGLATLGYGVWALVR
jgi:putative Ca2+/H+ antiporter (TMEM165/GDT1 family)